MTTTFGDSRAAGLMGSVFGIVLLVVFAIIAVVFWFRIYRKMGYSGWLGLLMIVSPVNLIMFIYLAFAKWPIERDLEQCRQNVSDHTG